MTQEIRRQDQTTEEKRAQEAPENRKENTAFGIPKNDRAQAGQETEKKRNESPRIIRDGRNVFMREELSEEKPPGYAVKMLNLNQPERLLRMHFIREGHQQYADYNISGLVSLAEAVDDSALYYLYAAVFALEEAERELSELLLRVDKLSLRPDRIYFRLETGQVYFCYLPDKTESFQESISALMEFFVKTANPVEEQEILLLYGLYRKSREAQVTPEVLADFIRNRDNLPDHAEAESRYLAQAKEGASAGYSLLREDAGTDYAKKKPEALKPRTPRKDAGKVTKEEEREIYEGLGLETGDPDAAFHAFKRLPRLAEMPSEKPFEPTLEEELAHAVIQPEKGKGILGKLKAHLLEITVGAVVLIVSAVVLLS